jgi:hypothetical protein
MYLFIPFTASPHATQHTGGHLGCMMDSYDIPEHWAVFYIAEAITALNVIHKVK